MLVKVPHVALRVGDQEELLPNAIDQGDVARVIFAAPLAGTYRFRVSNTIADPRVVARSPADDHVRIQLRHDLGADVGRASDALGQRAATLVEHADCASPINAVTSSHSDVSTGSAGTGTAAFRGITPFGDSCDGTIAFAFAASRSGRHHGTRIRSAVITSAVSASPGAPVDAATPTDMRAVTIGVGFEDARTTVPGDRRRGFDDWPCASYPDGCGSYDYSVDLTRGAPVEIHVHASYGVSLEMRWHGQVAASRGGEGSSSSSQNRRDFVFVPPTTGTFQLHIASSSERIGVLVLPGGTPSWDRDPGGDL
jgi:hypothetical protein